MLNLNQKQVLELSALFNTPVTPQAEIYWGVKGQMFVQLNFNGRDRIIRPDEQVYNQVLSILGKLPTF